MRLLDSLVVLATVHEAEPHHEACSALLLQGGHTLYLHALAEAFSTLTGGAQGLRVGAALVGGQAQVRPALMTRWLDPA